MPSSSVEVLWIARYDYQPHWRLAEHEHDYFQMIYFISGSACASLEGRDHRVGAGSLLLIKPHCVHALSPTSLVKTLDIKFLVRNRNTRRLLLDGAELLENCDANIAQLFERIRHEGGEKRPFYRELCGALLMEMVLLHLRESGDHGEEVALESNQREAVGDWVVQRASQFIRENHAVDFGATDIAKVVGCSDRYIRQHFKETLGISPRRYLLEYRVHKAQDLIQFSNYMFKEIAALVGFKTVHHFTRAFHEVSGETPGEWRRKNQAGICKDVIIKPSFVNVNRTIRTGPSQVHA